MEHIKIEWTKELLDEAPPFRGDGEPLKVKPIDGAKLFAAAQKVNKKAITRVLEGALEGEERFGAEARAVKVAFDAESAQGKKVTLVRQSVDRWVQRHGVADAVEMVLWLGKEGDFFQPLYWAYELALLRVREWLAHSADYDAALARAKALLAADPKEPFRAVTLAAMFPDHRPFVQHALGLELDVGQNHGQKQLLVSAITDADDWRTLTGAPEAWRWWCGRFGLCLVRRFGIDAFEMMRSMSSTGEDQYDHTFHVETITAFIGVEPAKLVGKHFGVDRSFKKMTETYFQRHPELAKAVLPGVPAKGKRKLAIEVFLRSLG